MTNKQKSLKIPHTNFQMTLKETTFIFIQYNFQVIPICKVSVARPPFFT